MGNAMKVDFKSVDERLAKAREEAEFWERARVLLADPRMEPVLNGAQTAAPAISSLPGGRPYGEVRRKVYEMLPGAGSRPGATTADLEVAMKATGYVFASKLPQVAINEALVALEKNHQARVVGKKGRARLWTKGDNPEGP